MSGRIHPLAQYLMVLALMIGAYSAYVRVVVPMIKGPANQVRRAAVLPQDGLPEKRDNKARLYRLLPSDGWELGQCKTLFTSQGTLLFQEMDRLDDQGNYALRPFTMIMNDHQSGTVFARGLDSSVPPTVLRCAEARLGFEGPILLTGDSKTRMQRAALNGEVTIFRPSPSPEKDEALRLVAHDVQVNASSIVALGDIAFSFGPHRGSGKTLTIELEHAPGASPVNPDFSTINGVSAVKLASLKGLRIEPAGLKKTGAPTSSVPARQSPAAVLAAANVPVVVTCAGPFRFDYATRTATFSQRVFVKQQDANGDNLNCHQLTVQFAEDQNPEDQKSSSSEPAIRTTVAEAEPPSAGTIENLVAKGDSANGQPVVMIANSRQTKITGDELEYRAADGQVVCRGNDQVSIVSPELNVRAKSLAYHMNPDGSLGDLDAVGPGEFFRKSADIRENIFLRWRRDLSIRDRVLPEADRPPGGRLPEKIIVIDGAAEVLVQEATHVSSDRLNIAVYEVPATTVGLASVSSEKAGRKFRYVPSEVYADTPVTIKSPNLDGTAGKLLVTWPRPNPKPFKIHQALSLNPVIGKHRVLKRALDGPAETSSSALTTKTRLRSLQGATSEAGPGSRFDQPASVAQAAWIDRDTRVVFDGSAVSSKDTLKQYVRFKGDEVRVRLESNSIVAGTAIPGGGEQNTGSQLLDLKINGNVVVHQYPGRDSREKPVRIAGDELRIVPQGKDIYRMLVAGKNEAPAMIDARGLKLSGAAIHLDQESNKMWVDGTGDMKVRQQEKKANVQPPTAEPDQAPAPTGDIDLQWVGGMVFDGAKIYFEGNVMMTSFGDKERVEKSITRTLSQALSISLAKRVDFRGLSGDRRIGQIEMSEMVLVNHIPDQLRVFELSPHVTTGAAATPGSDHFNRPDAPIIFQNESFDTRGTIVAQRRIAVPRARINARTNQVFADGPGKIFAHVVVPQEGKSSGSGDGATASWGGLGALTGNGQSGAGEGINYLQVNFEDQLVASLTDKQLKISGNIRTAFAPVSGFSDTVDPDAPADQLPDGAMKMRCNHIRMSQWQPSGRTKVQNEMVATGNVHVASPGFDAVSDRITYNDGNDQLVVEGTPRSPAKLWHRPTANAEKQQLLANKIIYHPAARTVETQGVQDMNVNIRN